MIVGFYTVTNTRISQESVAIRGAGTYIEVPVSLSLAAAGVVAPLGDIIGPGVAL